MADTPDSTTPPPADQANQQDAASQGNFSGLQAGAGDGTVTQNLAVAEQIQIEQLQREAPVTLTPDLLQKFRDATAGLNIDDLTKLEQYLAAEIKEMKSEVEHSKQNSEHEVAAKQAENEAAADKTRQEEEAAKAAAAKEEEEFQRRKAEAEAAAEQDKAAMELGREVLAMEISALAMQEQLENGDIPRDNAFNARDAQGDLSVLAALENEALLVQQNPALAAAAPDGTTVLPDGTVVAAAATAQPSVAADGTSQGASATVTAPDGTTVSPDGTAVASAAAPAPATVAADGTSQGTGTNVPLPAAGTDTPPADGTAQNNTGQNAVAGFTAAAVGTAMGVPGAGIALGAAAVNMFENVPGFFNNDKLDANLKNEMALASRWGGGKDSQHLETEELFTPAIDHNIGGKSLKTGVGLQVGT